MISRRSRINGKNNALRQLTSAVLHGHGGPTRLATPATCNETMSHCEVYRKLRCCHSSRHIQKLYSSQTGISHTKKRMITVSIKEQTIKNVNEETYAAMAIHK